MHNEKYLFLHFTSICALLLFLRGFFPTEVGNSIDIQNNYPLNINSSSSKMVLLIVDAMRADFLDGQSLPSTAFLQASIMRNDSCFIVTRAAAPTVTMPRIKAITSGYVPSYIDIALNFDSKEFTHDTFLRQASKRGLRSVFYGDDTWLKMFPNTFTRSAGVHSFFVSDFWEVDLNVTANLVVELERSDWDIMVLHYLGLDHIGHIEGPYSQNIKPKLREMDDVIRKISESLTRKAANTLFLVTSDHGMKNSGGHGGVTDPEIKIPLVSVGRPCRRLLGWPLPLEYIPPQIDIASTIAVALNLPIPSASIGKIIPHLLDEASITDADILNVLKLQKRRLLEHYTKVPLHQEILMDKKAILSDSKEKVINELFHELSELSEELARQQSEFHLTSIVMGAVFLWLFLSAVLGILLLENTLTFSVLHCLLIMLTVLHTLSLLSTSFIEEEHQTWYFLWATFLLFVLRRQLCQLVAAQRMIFDRKICLLLSLMVLHRIWRKLNQTGDKWANVPDLDDYLRSHPALLLAVFIFGLVWTFYLFALELAPLRVKILFLAVISSILCYRLAIRAFKVGLTENYPHSRGSFEVNIFFLLISIFSILSTQHKINFYWTWAALCLLTHRPHNVILVPGLIFVSKVLHSIFTERNDMMWNSIAHAWAGSLFYFYQGNSNSLANVDVAAGFIGVEEYKVAYAGFLIAVNTYSAPILAFLLSNELYGPVIIGKLLPLSLYCTTLIFQRHHLFVWSVFSPKLLLDSALYITLFVLFICFHSFNVLSGKRT